MPFRTLLYVLMLLVVARSTYADDVLYRWEADVVPYDESAGWDVFQPCEDACVESIEDGHFVLRWAQAGDHVNYNHWIASSTVPPPSLWVEFRFRSNHPLGQYFYSCDAWFSFHYQAIHRGMYLYGDAVFNYSGDFFVTGLEIDQFHTYRIESPDGNNYRMSVDGQVFRSAWAHGSSVAHYVQFGGMGGCTGDQIPNMVNEWDFIRYGTVSSSEVITASDPPAELRAMSALAGPEWLKTGR